MAQLAARGSHNPKVAGSIPVESIHSIPVSLGGQDTRLSPERPGFNSRSGNFFSDRSIELFYFKKLIKFTENYTLYKQLKSRLTNAGVA